MSREQSVVTGRSRTRRRCAMAGVVGLSCVAAGLANASGHEPIDCFIVHAQPGCDRVACSEAICSFDPHCCEVTWDAFCVAHANQRCTARLGDLNGDGTVDSEDLGALLARWGMVEGDVSGDLATDGSDLAIVIANWAP